MPRLSHVVFATLLAISAAKPCGRITSSQLSPTVTQGTSASYSNVHNISTVMSSASSTASTVDSSGSLGISAAAISSYPAQNASFSISYTPLTPGSEASTISFSATEPSSSSATESTTSAATTTTDTSTTESSTTTTASTEPSASSTGNQCLEALALQTENAVADCSARLIVTVTPPASTVTQTETVTAIESTVDFTLFTETVTTTDVTETLVFTTSTTITASTETDTITEQTTSTTTTTTIDTASTTVSTTSFDYLGGVTARGLAARETASPALPDYAATACSSWDEYVSACQYLGVETSTVTLPAATETVTEPISTSATTTWSTVSSTQTDVVSKTATVSSTEIDIESLTTTTTTTQTDVVTSTVTVVTTTTPTSVDSLSCQATGISFRVRAPNTDGTTRYMNVVNTLIAWQTFGSSPSASSLASSTWILNAGGYLGLASGTQVAYYDVTSTASSVQIKIATTSTVNAGIAAGTYAEVQGCVDRQTNNVTLTASGRYNILSCGNALYLSTGSGTDIRSDCQLMVSTAVLT
ncbi:hypothetical protein AB5N19_09870 [Seiridium cardinale]